MVLLKGLIRGGINIRIIIVTDLGWKKEGGIQDIENGEDEQGGFGNRWSEGWRIDGIRWMQSVIETGLFFYGGRTQ